MGIRLSQFARPKITENSLKLRDIEREDVIITHVTFGESRFGEYAILEIVRNGGEKASVITSAFYVLAALHEAQDAHAFPCSARFIRSGNAWTIE